MSGTELRDTARWAASVTLQLGELLHDNYDVSWVLGNAASREYYERRFSTFTVKLIRDLSNFDLDASAVSALLQDITTAGQLTDRIAARLKQNETAHDDRRAAVLPFDESQPDDTVGAI
jgi:hypothetical protein